MHDMPCCVDYKCLSCLHSKRKLFTCYCTIVIRYCYSLNVLLTSLLLLVLLDYTRKFLDSPLFTAMFSWPTKNRKRSIFCTWNTVIHRPDNTESSWDTQGTSVICDIIIIQNMVINKPLENISVCLLDLSHYSCNAADIYIYRSIYFMYYSWPLYFVSL